MLLDHSILHMQFNEKETDTRKGLGTTALKGTKYFKINYL